MGQFPFVFILQRFLICFPFKFILLGVRELYLLHNPDFFFGQTVKLVNQ